MFCFDYCEDDGEDTVELITQLGDDNGRCERNRAGLTRMGNDGFETGIAT
jgi:hypothetical protein